MEERTPQIYLCPQIFVVAPWVMGLMITIFSSCCEVFKIADLLLVIMNVDSA